MQGLDDRFVPRDEFVHLSHVIYFIAGMALVNAVMTAVVLIVLLARWSGRCPAVA
ncbi:MAG: hypothetical protein OXG33_04290 [Chloroflexi bacterium]|nr:hypothetical protein [Chloroflexota bacterium]